MIVPLGAEPIIKARLRGYKPREMIAVSLVGTLEMANHTVHAKPNEEYDWRWVRGLDVCICFADGQNWAGSAKKIALQRPEHLSVWSCSGRWGATVYLVPTADDISKPIPQWGFELDFLPWLDFQNKDFQTWN